MRIIGKSCLMGPSFLDLEERCVDLERQPEPPLDPFDET